MDKIAGQNATDTTGTDPGVCTTRGTTLFDAATYGGLAWLVNAGVSIGIAYKMKHGSWRPGFNKIVDFSHKNVFTPVNKVAPIVPATREFADGASELLSLMSGGFVMMAPVKWMEDYKEPIVKKLDSVLYDDKPATQARLKEAHSHLSKEHKQDWTSILGSRALALVGVYSLYIPGHKMLDVKLFDPATEKIIKFASAPAEGKFATITNLTVKDISYAAYCTALFYPITRIWHNYFGGESKEQAPIPVSPESKPQATVRDAAHVSMLQHSSEAARA